MQLQIKTLSNEKFTIEYELTDTVKIIKEKIAAKDLKDKYEADAVKLIFSGKILEDSKTIEFYSITQDSYLVVVKQQPSKNPTASAAPTNTQSNTATSVSSSARPANVAQPTPSTASQQPAAPPTQQQQQPSWPTPASGNAPAASQDSFLSPEAREKALTELTDMGFDRAQSELALRASFYHVKRAAEYLITGNIPSEGSASQGGESEEISSDSGHEQPIPIQDLSELNHNPRFRALRRIVQEDHDQRKTLMATLKATQPVLYQLIEQRPQQFDELLNQVDEENSSDDDEQLPGGAEDGGMGGQGAPGTVTVTLSPQDQQAISRLQDMGFERNRVIDAFLVCDRSEELAANYLLSSFD